VVGAPNVGKSTFVNACLGHKVAIVSPKPQTTRHRVLGILTTRNAQIIFVDTPGIHRPFHKLGEYMVQTTLDVLSEVDVVLWLVDVSRDPTEEDASVAESLSKADHVPVALLLNKADLADGSTLTQREMTYKTLAEVDRVFVVSSVSGQGLDTIMSWLVEMLPEGPQYYPEDQITDREERFLAAELIREQALHHLRQEVPHSIAVTLDEFKERENGVIYIAATIYVEKASQKGIVIGKGGSTLKRISMAARNEIETLTGRHVYLDLWVKVRHNWRRNEAYLRQLGYRIKSRHSS